MDKGIPKEKIVVGKPVNRADAANTGYLIYLYIFRWVAASDLHHWAARAASEIGW